MMQVGAIYRISRALRALYGSSTYHTYYTTYSSWYIHRYYNMYPVDADATRNGHDDGDLTPRPELSCSGTSPITCKNLRNFDTPKGSSSWSSIVGATSLVASETGYSRCSRSSSTTNNHWYPSRLLVPSEICELCRGSLVLPRVRMQNPKRTKMTQQRRHPGVVPRWFAEPGPQVPRFLRPSVHQALASKTLVSFRSVSSGRPWRK
jgi:hypothetical protein